MFKSKLKLKYAPFIFALTFITPVSGIMLQHPITVFAGDATGATSSIADILKNQRSDGGWIKYYNQPDGDWGKSTIDNKATYTEIRRLAAEYTKTKNTTYSAAALKGINFLVNMQYSNGGWPQIYKSTGYHTHITYNDNAMISVMVLLDEVSNKKGDFSFVDSTLANKCKISVQKGIDCILKTQVNVNGKLTAWGQQHDEVTLKPTGARAYELPSLCTSESVGIINFLKTRPTTPAIATSIKSATDWFKTVAITGIKIVKTSSDVVVVKDSSVTTPIWARFYEIGTNKPIFVGRDGIVKYALANIELERRTGYAWYGNWGSKISTSPTPTAIPTPKPTAIPTPKPTATPTTTTKVECENMTLGGSYVKKITSPVSGVALYGNNDYCKYTQYFGNPTHSFSVKGCSSNSSTARVDLQIGGKTVGSFYFSGTTPTVKTLSNISHGTGNQEVKLIATTDNGTWDVYVDYLQIN